MRLWRHIRADRHSSSGHGHSSPVGVAEHFEEKRREDLRKQRAATAKIAQDKRAEEERARLERDTREKECRKRQFALPPMLSLSDVTPEREKYLTLPRVFMKSTLRLSVMVGVEFEATPAEPLLLIDDCVETLVLGRPSRVDGVLIIEVGSAPRDAVTFEPPSCDVLKATLTKRPLRTHPDWSPAFITREVASVRAADLVTQRLGYGTEVLRVNDACGLIASTWGMGFVDVDALGSKLDDDASLQQRELKATSKAMKARWAAVRALQSATKDALDHAKQFDVPSTKTARCREVKQENVKLEQLPTTNWRVKGAPAVFRAAWIYEPSECDCCDCERCGTWLRVELDVPGAARDLAVCE